MTELFIPYEEAIAMQELGFDEPCVAYYDVYHKLCRGWGITNPTGVHLESLFYTSAPTWDQCWEWFISRGFKIAIDWNDVDLGKTEWFGRVTAPRDYEQIRDCKSYAELKLACLKKLIELSKEVKA